MPRVVRVPAHLLPSNADLAAAGAFDAARSVKKNGGRVEYALRDTACVAGVAAHLSSRPLRFASVIEARAAADGSDDQHQAFHADDATDASAQRAIVYLSDVPDDGAGALELRDGGAVTGARGTAAVYRASELHRGRAVRHGAPSRFALGLAFSDDATRGVTTIGSVLLFSGGSTNIDATSYNYAEVGGVLSEYNGTTYELAFIGDCSNFIRDGGVSITIENGDGLAYGVGGYEFTNVIVGRTWPSGLQIVAMDLGPWTAASTTLSFVADVSGYTPATWAFPDATWDKVIFVRSGNDLQILLHLSEGAGALDLTNINQGCGVLYDSSTDAENLGGAWFGGGGGGMCVDGAALVTMADGALVPLRSVKAGAAVRAVDWRAFHAALQADPRATPEFLSSTVTAHHVTRAEVGPDIRMKPWLMPSGTHGATCDTVLSPVHALVSLVPSTPALLPAGNVAGTRAATDEEAAGVLANGTMVLHSLQLASDYHAMYVNGVLTESLRGVKPLRTQPRPADAAAAAAARAAYIASHPKTCRITLPLPPTS